MRRRPAEDEEQDNHERWLVSYADFITLLFAFFTTLYAISIVDAEKQERLVYSIQQAFGEQILDLDDWQRGLLEPGSELPLRLGDRGTASAGRSDLDRLDVLEERMRELEGRLESEETLSVGRTDEGLVISLADSFFFSRGGAGVPDAALPLLREVVDLIGPLPNHIRVEGHTDTAPISTRSFPSNWHLSAIRAVEIVREFERGGIEPARLSASGFGPHRPLVSNGSLEGRRINRRVDIVVLRARLSSAPRS